MVPRDIAVAMSLTDTIDWGLLKEDFEFMMKLEPAGCFVAMDDGKFVGLAITILFENLGWIGNVIVDSNYRTRGVGSLLVKEGIAYLKGRGASTVGLYSYMGTVSFYERLGFQKDRVFTYLLGSGAKCGSAEAIRRMKTKDLGEVLKFDKRCLSFSRDKLLRRLFDRFEDLCYVACDEDDLTGFVMARKSPGVVEIGPLVCALGAEGKAVELLCALLRRFIGLEVYMGVPESKREIFYKLKEVEFRELFKVVRMYYGDKPQDNDCVFGMESLERG